METSRIWLITGASQGLGLAMVKNLLTNGQKVIATTRNKNKFDDELSAHKDLEILTLDLSNEQAVSAALNDIVQRHGRIDVLINNAGHGFAGAIEEASETEIEQVLAINVQASLRMIRHVLPFMRQARSGHIINLSSTAGLISTAGWGIYNASKYALEGFSEALSHEVKDFGIKVTIVEPGAFRTNFLDNSLVTSKQVIADYEQTAGLFKKTLADRNGKQPGNPEKAAAAICQVVEMREAPLRLLLGSDAHERAKRKIALLETDFKNMEQITLSVDFDAN